MPSHESRNLTKAPPGRVLLWAFVLGVGVILPTILG
jgi:hypothetical protein